MGTNPKTNEKGLWSMTVGQREASLKALERAIFEAGGNPKKLFDLFRTNSAFTQSVAQAIVESNKLNYLDVSDAKRILGNNIFTIADWQKYCFNSFSEKQIQEFNKFPWNEKFLDSPCPFNKGLSIKQTHFAFIGLESINKEFLHADNWHSLNFETLYSIDTKFMRNPDASKLKFRWYLMLKKEMPGSSNKTIEQQMAMLPESGEYQIPTLEAQITKMTLCNITNGYKSSGCSLCQNDFKTFYVDSHCCPMPSICVEAWNENSKHRVVGMSALRKI